MIPIADKNWQAWSDRIKAGERWTPPPIVPAPPVDAGTAVFLAYWSPAAVEARKQAEQAAADPEAKPSKKRGRASWANRLLGGE